MMDASKITEHMEVVGSDGRHIGKVDHVRGEEIQLAKFDFGAGLEHHLIPLTWVERTDEKVHLKLTEDQAKAQWGTVH